MSSSTPKAHPCRHGGTKNQGDGDVAQYCVECLRKCCVPRRHFDAAAMVDFRFSSKVFWLELKRAPQCEGFGQPLQSNSQALFW